ETAWVVHWIRSCGSLEEEIARTELALLVVLKSAAHVQSKIESVPAARVNPVVGDSKSMFAINGVQPSRGAPVYGVRLAADEVDSGEEVAPVGARFCAAKIANRLLLMVVKYLSGPAHTRSHDEAMGDRIRVSHQQSAAEPVVGGRVVERIVHKAAGDQFSIAPICFVNGLVGTNVVIDSESPNVVTQ